MISLPSKKFGVGAGHETVRCPWKVRGVCGGNIYASEICASVVSIIIIIRSCKKDEEIVTRGAHYVSFGIATMS